MAHTQIQLRRDTAANWTATNPVLAAGEAGLDTTNRVMKVGDGTTAWDDLVGWEVDSRDTYPQRLSRVSYTHPSNYSTTSTSLTTVLSPNLRLPAFTVPANGRVRVTVEVTGRSNSTSAGWFLGLLEGSTEVTSALVGRSVELPRQTLTLLISGLTPGDAPTWDLATKVESGGTVLILTGTTTIVTAWTDPT